MIYKFTFTVKCNGNCCLPWQPCPLCVKKQTALSTLPGHTVIVPLALPLTRKREFLTLAFPTLPCPETYSLVLHPPARRAMLMSWPRFFPAVWICIMEIIVFSKISPTNYSRRVKTGVLLKFVLPLFCCQIGYWVISIEITSEGQPSYFSAWKAENKKSLLI